MQQILVHWFLYAATLLTILLDSKLLFLFCLIMERYRDLSLHYSLHTSKQSFSDRGQEKH